MAVISNELKWTQIWSDLAIQLTMKVKKQMKPIYNLSRLFQDKKFLLKAKHLCGIFIVQFLTIIVQILTILNVTVDWSKGKLTGDCN